MELLLKDKTLLITGGTSRLGQAVVRKAGQHGARVFFTYHRSSEVARDLEQTGAQGFSVDLAEAQAVRDFSASFKEKIDQLDILIHNAAANANALIENMSESQWEEVIRVNLKAPFSLTQQLLPLLLRKTPSKIFMIVSRAGFNGLTGAANYAASKGGLIAMTKTLAKELGRKKVLVNAVNPGFMKSAMTETLPEYVFKRNIDESPLKTVSDPDEVADFLLFLSSDRMRQVTGQVFHFESRPF